MARSRLPKIAHARQLRRETSTPERVFWRAVRLSFPERHWRRQVGLGRYFADFALHLERLVIEVEAGSIRGARTRTGSGPR